MSAPVLFGADHYSPFTSNLRYDATVYGSGDTWFAVDDWGYRSPPT